MSMDGDNGQPQSQCWGWAGDTPQAKPVKSLSWERLVLQGPLLRGHRRKIQGISSVSCYIYLQESQHIGYQVLTNSKTSRSVPCRGAAPRFPYFSHFSYEGLVAAINPSGHS